MQSECVPGPACLRGRTAIAGAGWPPPRWTPGPPRAGSSGRWPKGCGSLPAPAWGSRLPLSCSESWEAQTYSRQSAAISTTPLPTLARSRSRRGSTAATLPAASQRCATRTIWLARPGFLLIRGRGLWCELSAGIVIMGVWGSWGCCLARPAIILCGLLLRAARFFSILVKEACFLHWISRSLILAPSYEDLCWIISQKYQETFFPSSFHKTNEIIPQLLYNTQQAKEFCTGNASFSSLLLFPSKPIFFSIGLKR